MIAKLACVLLGLGMSACASSSHGELRTDGGLISVKVLSRSSIPPYTGLVKTWIRFDVKADRGDIALFYPNFEEQSKLPAVGATCSVRYHIEDIEGQIGSEIARISAAKVVDVFECGESTAR